MITTVSALLQVVYVGKAASLVPQPGLSGRAVTKARHAQLVRSHKSTSIIRLWGCLVLHTVADP